VIALSAYCPILREDIQQTIALGGLSKRAARGHVPVSFGWPLYARLRLGRMRLRAQWKGITQLALLPVRQVRPWQLRMLPPILSALPSTRQPPYEMRLTLRMPTLLLRKNVIGSTTIYLSCNRYLWRHDGPPAAVELEVSGALQRARSAQATRKKSTDATDATDATDVPRIGEGRLCSVSYGVASYSWRMASRSCGRSWRRGDGRRATRSARSMCPHGGAQADLLFLLAPVGDCADRPAQRSEAAAW
jgi:hypothetical protein